MISFIYESAQVTCSEYALKCRQYPNSDVHQECFS